MKRIITRLIGITVAATALSCFAGLTSTSFAACVTAPSGSTLVVDVQACIDGRDQLRIQGNMMQWQHYDGDAVGLHPSCPKKFKSRAYISTALNGRKAHKSVWKIAEPNGTSSGSLSSIYSRLCPSLPTSSMFDLTLAPVIARGSITIFQEPGPGNNETSIVQFNDDAFGAAAVYEARLTFQIP